MKHHILIGLLAMVASGSASAQAVFDAAPIAEAALGRVAGKADTNIVAQSNQTGTVADNSVGDGVSTGGVRIDGQAFQNMQGLSVLNVNTGNNVSMNTSMNVSVAINPGQ